uniref:Acetyl-coenzyme A carboxylase carboxyl transferase subunit beta, chloroplastic n=1 Tax=Oenothera biennis TaxID=3942 RepID=B0Z4W9_OENBI|nr:acetyl-CoA carboxylase beta subunit [Oenothera biennis]YP_010295289.1 acetyl-CoA carboxylase subunit beta [Oenothera biennis x Oenothera villosa]UMO91563.1 acetyl-CoA carboxylase subunit beta [Oenothera biennis x Oenothera glazioviana]ABW98881.1 acetyl-CoA carboxylase subunit beta [Oenothera biennis]ALR86512.1 acetyl-CoA carboxylase subunit beta [Oenothera biennis]ANC48977.1 acetyl-CoA carboxylase subunit beta [Oenothera biennis]AOY35038.1 acetyl-CoA carboxylase subunit beta [Oenothera bie
MKPTKPEGPKKPNKSNEEAEELEGDNKEDLEGDKQKDKKDGLFVLDYDDEYEEDLEYDDEYEEDLEYDDEDEEDLEYDDEDEEDLEGDNKEDLEGDNKPHKEDLEGDNKPHKEDLEGDKQKEEEEKQKEEEEKQKDCPWHWFHQIYPKHWGCPHRKHRDRKSVPAKERELVPAQSTKRDTDPDSEASLKSNYAHLWVHCKLCSGFNYKKILKSKNNVCEQCGSHLKMHSSDRIDLMLDPKTWAPMHEGLLSLDPIEFHSEKDPYKDRVASYKRKTGLSEAIQTGRGYLKRIHLGIGLMDFQFMGGSMGSVVGERITRLVEYATNRVLPLILVCASGGARMQEGSLSLMQMAKISSALSDYQFNRTVFYVALLTSPTTGGVTASFGMLGDIILAEPNAYIAFAGKRVIEQTLNIEVPEGSQTAEYLFDKGLFDQIVPRNPLKGSLSELFNFHGFVTLNSQVINIYNYLYS